MVPKIEMNENRKKNCQRVSQAQTIEAIEADEAATTQS